MHMDGYILFKDDTGEPVPPLDSTGEPTAIWFQNYEDAIESAAWHLTAYHIDCTPVRCTMEVHDS